MGQYYTTIVKEVNDVCETEFEYIDSSSGDAYCGVKLMEHSWLGYVWADLIAYKLEKCSCRIAEVGDYANEYPLFVIAHNQQFIKSMNAIVVDDFKIDGEWLPFDYKDKYLVNIDKRLYIDFNKYMEKSKDEYGDCVSPMNLLCAQGNGRGGGDYREHFPHAEDVGSWAWDTMRITKEVPDCFYELDIYFKES